MSTENTLNIPAAASNLTLRAAQPQDAEPIAQLGRTVFQSTFGQRIPPQDLKSYLDEAYTQEQISADLVKSTNHFLVAIDSNGDLIGFANLRTDSTEPCVATSPRPVELQRVYVYDSQHGKGVGRALTARALELAQSLAFETVWLGVGQPNFKARRFYEKLGFVELGKHDFRTGNDVATDLILAKFLNGNSQAQ